MENNKKEQVNKTQVKKPEQAKKEVKTTEMIVLCKTSYHYYRNWLRELLKDAEPKFVKDEKGWKGSITVAKADVEKAKKLLADYKTKNPETKELS